MISVPGAALPGGWLLRGGMIRRAAPVVPAGLGDRRAVRLHEVTGVAPPQPLGRGRPSRMRRHVRRRARRRALSHGKTGRRLRKVSARSLPSCPCPILDRGKARLKAHAGRIRLEAVTRPEPAALTAPGERNGRPCRRSPTQAGRPSPIACTVSTPSTRGRPPAACGPAIPSCWIDPARDIPRRRCGRAPARGPRYRKAWAGGPRPRSRCPGRACRVVQPNQVCAGAPVLPEGCGKVPDAVRAAAARERRQADTMGSVRGAGPFGIRH